MDLCGGKGGWVRTGCLFLFSFVVVVVLFLLQCFHLFVCCCCCCVLVVFWFLVCFVLGDEGGGGGMYMHRLFPGDVQVSVYLCNHFLGNSTIKFQFIK